MLDNSVLGCRLVRADDRVELGDRLVLVDLHHHPRPLHHRLHGHRRNPGNRLDCNVYFHVLIKEIVKEIQ